MSTTFHVRFWFQPNIRLRNSLKVASLGSDPCELVDALAAFAAAFGAAADDCCALQQRLATARPAVINTAVQRFMVPFSKRVQI